MSDEEKAEIELGLKQADQGEVVSHSEVLKHFNKWKKKLFGKKDQNLITLCLTL